MIGMASKVAGVVFVRGSVWRTMVGGRSALEHLLEVYVATFDRVVVVADEPIPIPQCRVLVRTTDDELDDLAMALTEVPGSAVGVVVQPFSAAFTTVGMLRALLAGAGTAWRCLVHEGRATWKTRGKAEFLA